MKASFHTGKIWNIKHNSRTFDKNKWNKDNHIDYSRSELNETLLDIPFEQFVEETFGNAIEQFNEKNKSKHPERMKDKKQYYKECKKNVHEAIIQLGNHKEYWEMVEQYGQTRADEFHKKALKEQFERWKKENTSLKVFSATIHLDEVANGTPHLHIDYLPVATSTRGLTVKVSKDGAFKELGYVRKTKKKDGENDKYSETPFKRWEADYRTGNEELFQKLLDKEFGVGTFHVEPADKISKQKHKDPYKHNIEQNRAELDALIKAKEVSETKTVKNMFGKTKEVQKTKEEIEQDRIIAAAKLILDREDNVKQSEIAVRERQKAVEQELIKQKDNNKQLEKKRATATEQLNRHIQKLNDDYKKAVKKLEDSYTEKFKTLDEEVQQKVQQGIQKELHSRQAEIKTLDEEIERKSKLADIVSRQTAANTALLDVLNNRAGQQEQQQQELAALRERSY